MKHFYCCFRTAVAAVHWHPKGVSLLSVDKMKKTVIWTP